MYNSFIYKKHSQQLERQHKSTRKDKNWQKRYKKTVRPALIQKYSRRINTFVTRLEQDKKDFYEYRQQTQAKAHELLKEIYRKQKFVGDPTMKLRDLSDWASMLSPTERIQKERNQRMFETKYGDSNIAYRSIASQSVYQPPDSTQFRTRNKERQIHRHNMRFTSKSQAFADNKKDKVDAKARVHTNPHPSHHCKSVDLKEDIHRSHSSYSYADDDVKSHNAFSVFSVSGQHQKMASDGESSTSNNREAVHRPTGQGSNTNKVYFKQIVDLQQHTRDPSVKRSLHQILVRFGMSRIKDIKKQAMMQTDILEEDQF